MGRVRSREPWPIPTPWLGRRGDRKTIWVAIAASSSRWCAARVANALQACAAGQGRWSCGPRPVWWGCALQAGIARPQLPAAGGRCRPPKQGNLCVKPPASANRSASVPQVCVRRSPTYISRGRRRSCAASTSAATRSTVFVAAAPFKRHQFLQQGRHRHPAAGQQRHRPCCSPPPWPLPKTVAAAHKPLARRRVCCCRNLNSPRSGCSNHLFAPFAARPAASPRRP